MQNIPVLLFESLIIYLLKVKSLVKTKIAKNITTKNPAMKRDFFMNFDKAWELVAQNIIDVAMSQTDKRKDFYRRHYIPDTQLAAMWPRFGNQEIGYHHLRLTQFL